MALTAPTARGDGDPASDYLLTVNVFLPYEAPSAAESAALEAAVGEVYAHGNRVKVAVIGSIQDLGAVPTLFGHPALYARFLATEISNWYRGPVLVAMPSGFGIYDQGRSTALDDRVLGSVSLTAGTPDELTASATQAVQRLEAAGALRSPDTLAPLVDADPASAVEGKPATLHFDVYDDSGRCKATVRIYENGMLIATLEVPMVFAVGTRRVAVRWLVPNKLSSRLLRFCVTATDPAGNRSAQECQPFLRVR